MLPDLERKLLRIIHNFWSQRRRMPTLKELERTTGREERVILTAIGRLESDGYLQWPDKPKLDSLRLVNAPGAGEQAKARPRGGLRSDIDYWTNY
ncbi:hypothetical protein [Paenibacillus ihumii]|uniref:hypothetical protein n=1 Tax=Paenibacillus ihumii TaxID=687436 RepID=UPI0006D85D22|nr:hypothetical protein [Paenibacillus ihumii]